MSLTSAPVLHNGENDSPADQEIYDNLYVTPHYLIEEILRSYGIEIKEKDEHTENIVGTIDDPMIKDQMYEAVVNELNNGSTYALEFMLEDKLLSHEDLIQRGVRNCKEAAIKLLRTSTGVQRTRDKESFIASGILTPMEAADVLYSSK